jgi:26S proteasome regulatory subunit N9
VQIASVIAQQLFPSRPMVAGEVRAAIAFMEGIAGKRARLGDEAFLVARMAVAELLVQLGQPADLKQARGMLDESQPLLAALAGSGAETAVNSSFYRVACELYKVAGPADEYYKSCIQFMAYTPVETLSPPVQQRLAIDMSLAALVAETVFNYGEVLAQPVLAALENSEHAWLRRMLEVFNQGDIDGFSALSAAHKQQIAAQPVLAANFELLRQKIALLCLMQVVFMRPPEDRALRLDDVALVTKLPRDQVEWLLMKAMSKGLIKGKIDQVDELVHISWLKPRVLDRQQLDTLHGKLKVWQDSVGATLGFIESETPDLFAV